MILVIGATGFIGRHLVTELIKENAGNIRVTVRDEKGKKALAKFGNNIEIVEADTTNLAALRKAMQGVKTVFNFAQVTANFKNKNNLYHKVNVEGTQNVVNTAKEAGVQYIILGSGLGTVPAKAGSYMQTRWEAEEIVRKSGISYTILQPSILFGKGSEFFEAQARVMKLTWPVAVVIGNGKLRFQPVYVEDVVRATALCLAMDDKRNKSIEIAGDKVYTFKELIVLLKNTLGKKRVLLYQPVWLMKMVAAIFSILPKPPLTPATLELFSFENVAKDLHVIEKEFHFKPVALEEYLAKNGI
jgi:NADH dehydrogenase